MLPFSMLPEFRSKMISFRLTIGEYERFRELCFAHGVRSVSELARAAIHMLLEQSAIVPQQSLESRIAAIEGRLHMLSLEIKRLSYDRSSAAGVPSTAM
jgi:hypothetical protein